MAKDTLFIQILGKLGEIHEKYDDLRFGQILQSALDIQKKKPNVDLHNFSSKVILKALNDFDAETKNKRGR